MVLQTILNLSVEDIIEMLLNTGQTFGNDSRAWWDSVVLLGVNHLNLGISPQRMLEF